MRWICVSIPLSLVLCCLFSSIAYSQVSTAVVEARIISISAGPTYELQIEQVRNGKISKKIITVNLVAGKEALQIPLRRFKSQSWLMTLIGSNDQWRIRAAFGQGSKEELDDHELLPEPLISEVIDRQDKQDARTLNIGAQEQAIVELTNIERWNNGALPPFKQVNELHTSADCHSERMADADFFAHCDLYTNLSPFTRMTNAGYSWNAAAENIAAGSSTASATMSQWMNSSGHRASILSTTRREIGVGYDYGGGGPADRFDNGNCDPGSSGGPYYHYWTQNFGRRNAVSPLVIERELATTTSQTVDLYIYGIYGSNTTSMRFQNENGSWSNWTPYTPDHQWTLSSGNGTKTVNSQVSSGSNGSGTIRNGSDQIELNGNCSTMTFSNQTLSGSSTYTDCEIIADPNVMISGQIIFQANSVTLGNSVEIPFGATLDVQIQ